MEMKFYRCAVCGKVIAILTNTGVPTVCCGKEMIELNAGTTDGAAEKHVPVVNASGNTVEVQVGSVIHPMEEKHYIEWIALQSEQGISFKNLKPGEEPKAKFSLTEGDKVVRAIEYCNLHRLWATK